MTENSVDQTVNTRRENATITRKPLKIGKNVDPYELKRLPIVLRSKYTFYTEPSNKVGEAQNNSQKRIQQFKKRQQMEREKTLRKEASSLYSPLSIASLTKSKKKLTLQETEEMIKFEKERHERLIGQLKAAEAKNRSRILKLRYYNLKEDEIENLIESQSSALKAVRLEAFLPSVREKKVNVESDLTPIQKRRLESILDDSNAFLIERKLN